MQEINTFAQGYYQMNTAIAIATAKPNSGVGGWAIGSSDKPSGVGFAPKQVGGAEGETINIQTSGLVLFKCNQCIYIPFCLNKFNLFTFLFI